MATMEAVQGGITTMRVDAIVNAAHLFPLAAAS